VTTALPERHFEFTESKLLEFVRRIAERATGREVQIDPQALAAGDPRRYQYTGRISDTGVYEAVDTRTGRRGATGLFSSGFSPGLLIHDDGRTEWENPCDNPYQGCRW
jgi:hypothetical protein